MPVAGSTSTSAAAEGRLKRRQLAAAVVQDVARGHAVVAGRDRDHHRRLAPAVVRDADDDGGEDARVLAGHRLDLGRGDVEAAADDQVLQPPREVEKPGLALRPRSPVRIAPSAVSAAAVASGSPW